MGLSDIQIRALKRRLSPRHIRSRQVHGRTLSYIEGWHAIAEANRIFGYDGWDRETLEFKCVAQRRGARQRDGRLHRPGADHRAHRYRRHHP